jgi:glycosyltransferase involved in cell wall biosynthesis
VLSPAEPIAAEGVESATRPAESAVKSTTGQRSGPHPRAVPRRRLRVAMVHISDFRLDSRIQRQARALAERGDEVDLVCVGEREQLRVGDGVIRVHPVATEKAAGGASAYLRDYGRFLARALWRLTALDIRRRFDLVEVHNMPDLLTAAALGPRLRGTPVILNMHDTFPELFATKYGRPEGDRLEALLEVEERLSAMLASRVVTVTDQARLRVEGRGVGVGHTTVVMNSPDERVFGPARVPVRWPAEGPLRVLYHGGLAPRFGVQTLIEAWTHLRERASSPQLGGRASSGDLRECASRLHLRVCGSGEDRDRLAALAAEIDPERIDVAPRPVPFERIPAELQEAHIGVVPTLHDRFTELLLPVKLLEYVHMGLPVVSSRLPGISGYFSERELREFTPGDPGDLARAIESVCADPYAARERSARATRKLAGIAWEQQRARYLALVDELTGVAHCANPAVFDAPTLAVS